MRRSQQSLVACLTVALFGGLASPAAAEWETAGSVTACVTRPAGADCTFDSGGAISLELYGDDLLRVRITSDGLFRDRPTGALVDTAKQPNQGQAYNDPSALFLVSPKLTVGLFKAPFRLVVWRADGSLVSVTEESGIYWDRTTGVTVIRYHALPGERYLGLGERGGPIDRRGRSLTMRNTDTAAFGSLTDPLYISIPFYYTFSEGKASGVYVDSGATPFFNFDAQADGVLSFGTVAGDLDYYVMGGPQPPDVSRAFRQLTGPNQIPPLWTLGFHQSRYSYMTQDETLATAWLLRAHQIPSDVLYFDIDYLDTLRMFTWNQAAFPDPASMNQLLKSWGFRSVNIMEPINHIGDPLHAWLAQSGYYLTGPNGQPLVNSIWFGQVSWLDYSKAAVRDWYKSALRGFMGAFHIDGVWNDLNEPAQNYMPEAVYNFDGQPRSDAEARNLYALLGARTSFEAQRELRPNTRPWVFSRSGSAGLHRYGANWGGDADTSFASLRSNVEMSLSMGLSGQPFFGHDIGGFLGSPSAELFLRWMTFSAYTPLFRSHAMNTSERREPWAFGEPYLSMSRNIINERYRLIPYIYSLFHHDASTGQPVVAPLPFHFPADETTYVIDDEFLLGPSLLVAPVLTEGAVNRWVYLPAGASWIDQRTDTVSAGGSWVLAPAAIDEIPVFVRDGSIVPRAPVAQSTALQPLDRRSLDVYCGVPARFELYEDDGLSLELEQGVYLTSDISCTPGAATEVAIERTGGTWAPPAARQWRVHLHRTPAQPSAVRRGIVPLPFVATESDLDSAGESWTYTPDQRVVVKVNDQAAPLHLTIQP